MKRLLTLKHWQLFGILFGIPFVFQIVFMAAMFASPDFRKMALLLPLIFLISLLFGAIFFSWFYAMGTNLPKLLPAEAKMSVNRFKFFLFFPLVYLATLAIAITIALGHQAEHKGDVGSPWFALIIIPHLFSMFCIFYSLYFIAKAFKAAELQRAVTFNDFAGEFFLIWFYPIGIWIIQPRINKLFGTQLDNGSI